MRHADRALWMRLLLPLLLAVLGGACGAAAAAPDRGPGFSFPVACTPGQDCWILQYPDTDPGPGWADYACGKRSHDGHSGSDIFIGHVGRITAGVEVRAAADGVVAFTRDGLVDKLADAKDPALDKVACGNHVTIDHGGGWVTRLCHMRQGSVRVKVGDRVARGQPLGQVGMSGLAAFPHVHFEVYKDLKLVDPFVGREAHAGCTLGSAHLWSGDAVATVAYRPVDIWRLGFVEGAVDANPSVAPLELIRPGITPSGTFPLTLVADMLGLRAGDGITVTVAGPQGSLAKQHTAQPKDAISNRIVLKLGNGPWRPGSYSLQVTIERADGGHWSRTAEMSLR